jgi:hypothetical protein
VFKRFVIGFALGMAATHYAITSSLPLFDDLEQWLRGTQSNYTGQKTHKAASQVFDHER